MQRGPPSAPTSAPTSAVARGGLSCHFARSGGHQTSHSFITPTPTVTSQTKLADNANTLGGGARSPPVEDGVRMGVGARAYQEREQEQEQQQPAAAATVEAVS